MITSLRIVLKRFSRDDQGLALTEYLVALSILIGAVLVAVALFGQALGTAFITWAGYVLTALSP